MPQLNSLSDYLSLLNQQLISQWALFDYHRQLDSVLRVMLDIGFLDESKVVVYEHIHILGNVVKQARTCNVSLLSRLIYVKELLTGFDGSPE